MAYTIIFVGFILYLFAVGYSGSPKRSAEGHAVIFGSRGIDGFGEPLIDPLDGSRMLVLGQQDISTDDFRDGL